MVNNPLRRYSRQSRHPPESKATVAVDEGITPEAKGLTRQCTLIPNLMKARFSPSDGYLLWRLLIAGLGARKVRFAIRLNLVDPHVGVLQVLAYPLDVRDLLVGAVWVGHNVHHVIGSGVVFHQRICA
ncbi:hypothetical protein RJ639_009335 [Escallonia herrerae]|uniref:Uncharacterized protein n=1 Tax=Escallonia herrerae TaxID=1293975 RepID=A0AA88VS98_9ASTE|nr:hypothetical protein RJ639_009335 [Escallonia herrerae]